MRQPWTGGNSDGAGSTSEEDDSDEDTSDEDSSGDEADASSASAGSGHSKLAQERVKQREAGFEWELKPHPIDNRQRRVPWHLTLNMENPQLKSPLDFFLHFLPIAALRDVATFTDETGSTEEADWRPLLYPEFLRFIAVVFLMSLDTFAYRRFIWMRDPDSSLKQAESIRSLMSRNRFEAILRCLTLSPPIPNIEAERGIGAGRCWVNALNRRFAAAVTAGEHLVVDESMISCLSLQCKFKAKIPRKPIPVGIEFKTVCDGESKILLFMEPNEGKVSNLSSACACVCVCV